MVNLIEVRAAVVKMVCEAPEGTTLTDLEMDARSIDICREPPKADVFVGLYDLNENDSTGSDSSALLSRSRA